MKYCAAALVLIGATCPAPGEGKVTPGHSNHGEAFNEGPRQAARPIPNTGRVSFGATSKSPEAKRFVDQGVGQLHGFWYLEAERSFRQAAKLDPDCAVAYWGMAMANANNSKRARGFIAEAVARKANCSEREAMHIDALSRYLNDKTRGRSAKKVKGRRYIKDLRAVVEKFPDDTESLAFYGLALYKYRRYSGRTYDQIDAVLKKVLAREPLHPVHHYVIHLWDYKNPRRALGAAAKCGPAAGAIAHMWHMPGHIYSRLHRYGDAAWQQEASARVDHAQMMRDRLMPDQIHNFAHNNEWLIRNLIHLGRVKDAADLAKNMIGHPQHPKYNTFKKRGSARYGRQRLFDVLYTYEMWGDLIELANGPLLPPTEVKTEQVKRLRYLGAAYARGGLTAEAGEVLKELKKLATNKKRDPVPAAVKLVEGYLAAEKRDYKTAAAKLKEAGEDALSVAGMRLAAGDEAEALKAARDYVDGRPNQVRPQAVLAEMLWRAGEADEARAAFAELQKISGSVQLGSPVFARLEAMAAALGLPKEWRQKRPAAKDLGERPDLAKLGPFRWSPWAAPAWSLPAADGRTLSRADFKGEPVVMIFYLGSGCIHCAEQLQKFAPMAERFNAAGISLAAVSLDDRQGLQATADSYENGLFPFPLLSDPGLKVFRAYRAYDDFEGVPLHGTFLIDGDGKVRWQDISYEPFMDAEFLLKEAKRLLARK